ncbi:MAG: O-antigen ligase family protein [Thermoleophilia bacterium]|nr:O-antigen ligase family protein [Thermoleophilia bacterium]
MIDRAVLRGAAAPLVLAAVPAVLALRFGGYHPRHLGWVVLGLVGWACVLAVLGRLSRPRSLSGVATIALAGLAAWTAASIAWADVSRHDAWVEAMRALGYLAAFVVGGALLANARSFARYAWMAGAATAVLAGGVLARVAFSDVPLKAFVAGRLDWPVGYAPGMAGLCLMGWLLLLGVGCSAQQRHERLRGDVQLAVSGAALAGAGLCLSAALLAQSRGTVPALAVGVVAALVATPDRTSWLVRAGATIVAVALIGGRLTQPFQAMFDLRQAPFTKGADEDALYAAAVDAAHAAGMAALIVAAALAVVGAALVPLAEWLRERVRDAEQRIGMGLAVPAAVLVVALGGTLVVAAGTGDGTPIGWARTQVDGCLHPPDTTNDPGSSSSYFANSGTGRCDYYRVALRAGAHHPVLGLGAGNFRGEYVRERTTREEPKVVHSLPLQLWAELGLVGAALGATVLGCVVLAAVRFVRSGPARDATFAGAVAALAYWTMHASIDWLWQLPAVSLPAVILAGGLTACVSPAQGRVPRSVAGPIAGGVAVVALALVLPVTMADAKLREARDPALQESSPGDAITAAQDAQSFDPTWAEPAITEAILWNGQGRSKDAATAAKRAVKLQPRDWSVQYRASGLIGLADRAAGLAAYQAARRLNPQLDAQAEAGTQERDGAEGAKATGAAKRDPDSLQQ